MAEIDLFAFEREARGEGYTRIAGGDEAGRGPWAGPVFAAFAILPHPCAITGLNDSKQLTREERRRLYEIIRAEAVAWGIGRAEPEEIDRYNILEATRLAFRRAFEALDPAPDFALLDYIKLPWMRVPHRAFAKGDSLSASIAAASILAKEARDRVMEELDGRFPGYGFAKHMGYGTPQHQEALQRLGPCPIHRRSFKPIKALLPDTEPRHATLF
ncbi:MAG TPA: ribonuclease HII [Candidatus Ozemobacteraceae bacterium]